VYACQENAGSPLPRAPLLLSSNDPPQVFVVVSGETTVILAGEVGKVSVKATLLKAFAGLGLVIKNVRVDVPPGPIVLGKTPSKFVEAGPHSSLRRHSQLKLY